MNLGKVLRMYRLVNEIGFREFAKELKISAATLNRIEMGKSCSMEVSMKILYWLFK